MKETSKKRKTFEYYRYKVAEWLHKAVNIIMFTRKTDFGWRSIIDEDDIKRIQEVAKIQDRDFDDCLEDVVNDRVKMQDASILYTLNADGYLDRTIEYQSDGTVIVGFRLKMLGLKAISILNDNAD